MSTSFPGSLDDSTDLPSDRLNNTAQLTAHVSDHNNLADAVLALEAKVGVDSSAVTTSLDYLVKNASSSDPGHVHTAASISGAIESGDAAGGDLSGTYPNPSVTDDSHAHTGATLSAIPETDITDGSLLARVGDAETITGAWTFNAGKLLDKGSLVYDAKAYGAAGDGATDDTTAVAAAIAAASAAGGGVVFFPEGTYLTDKFTLPSLVSLKGAGAGSTIIKLNTTQNTALLTTTSFVTTDTAGGIHSFTIEELTFDGNKANQASNGDSGCVQIYGYNYTLRNVRIRNAESVGLYTNYETGASAPGPDGISMEAYLDGVEVYASGTDGIYWNGPHDSIWNNVVAHENAAIGIHIETRGSGTLATNCHSWGTAQTYGWYINASGTCCTNCISEGASTKHVYIAQNDCQWIGGHIFAASGSTTGIEIANSSGGHLFNTKVSNCTTAAILFTSDGGNSIFDLNVYATSGAVSSGTKHADTLLRAISNGGATGNSARTILLGPWAAENLAAGVGPAALTIDGQGVVGTIPMMRAGSITGVIVRTNDARTAGTLTIEVTKNGTGIGLTAVLNGTNTAFHASLQAPGTDAFAIGDTIGVIVTTDGSWAPTTSDQVIMVEVVY